MGGFFKVLLEIGLWFGLGWWRWGWGEVDGFEMYFVDGLDVGGKGKRILNYLFSVIMWVLVLFIEIGII